MRDRDVVGEYVGVGVADSVLVSDEDAVSLAVSEADDEGALVEVAVAL